MNRIETGSSTRLHEMRDNASRLGSRGVEDLGGGLQALFGLEVGLGANAGPASDPEDGARSPGWCHAGIAATLWARASFAPKHDVLRDPGAAGELLVSKPTAAAPE